MTMDKTNRNTGNALPTVLSRDICTALSIDMDPVRD